MKIPKNATTVIFLLTMLSWVAVTMVVFAQATSQAPELKLKEPLERELSSGQTHDYQVMLNAGEFIQVRVEQKGIDIVLSIHSADGKELAQMDSPNENEGFEILSFIADRSASYTIKIERLEGSNSQSGSYNIALAAKRSPTELDRKRIQAEKQFLLVNQMQIETTEDIQPQIEKYKELVEVWKELGDSYVLGLIETTITSLREAKAKAEASARQAIAATTELKLNEPLERELASKETHDYRVTLSAGEFIQIRVEQKGIDVGLTINSANGKELAAMDSPNGQQGFETVSFIADGAGIYFVKVIRLQDINTQSGKYNITLTTKRTFTAQDQKRMEAERQFLAVNRMRVGKPEDRQSQIERYEKLLPIWQELNDEYIIGLIVKEVSTAKEREKVVGRELEQEEKRNNAQRRREIKQKAAANSPQLVVSLGHNSGITSVAISPDGKLLASSDDASVKIWDTATGQEIRTLTGFHDSLRSIAISNDGKLLASMEFFKNDGIRIWDLATAKVIKTFKHSSLGKGLVFSRDGKVLISGGDDKKIKFWDMATGKESKTLTGHSSSVNSLSLSADGKLLASGSEDLTVKLWDVGTGKEIRTLTGHTKPVWSVSLSPNGKVLASGSEDQTIRLWDTDNGQVLKTLPGSTDIDQSISFSPDGKTLASGGDDCVITLWDVESGQEIKTFKGHSEKIGSVVFSPDGKLLASGSLDKTGKLWDIATGREIRTFTSHANNFKSFAFSPDRKTLASTSSDNTVKLWDLTTGKEIKTFAGRHKQASSLTISHDGNVLASASGDKIIKLWNISTGQEIRTLGGQRGPFAQVAFSPDDKFLATGDGNEIKIWEVATGKQIRTLTGHSDHVLSVAVSPDGKVVASSSLDNTVKLWNAQTGKEIKTLAKYYEFVSSVTFSPDGKVLVSGSPVGLAKLRRGNEVFRLWDVDSGRELEYTKLPEWMGMAFDQMTLTPNGSLVRADREETKIILRDVATEDDIATLIILDENDWAVVDPEGRWDASGGAQNLMYYALDTNEGYEVIDFSQLKERYYEPSLLQKLLGYNKEPLRDVAKFENPKLYPDVSYQLPAERENMLTINLTNRGGGIGRVQVFVNGKEFLADARDNKLKRNTNVPQATLNVDLSRAKGAISGKDNDIRIVAWNVENYISSRGTQVVWTAGGPTDRAPPEVYAVVAGISKYAGSQLNLNFAAKDAVDIANAIELGAKRLFGADKVHLALLTTAEDQRAIAPTKENFTKAFESARKAKPTDILIVYLAGHGITLQRGSDTYCYLTQEARTTDTAALSDSAVRKQETITSEELVEWIKEIPALKQVVMLDTCAAGAAQAQLKLVDKREASGDAIRAIDRAKDRTGSYILMGSAADAVSYEASQYGQGLLTYALLKGMKGAALNNDEFVDVSKLFQYAREEVEQLAKNVGGIQRPIIFAPKDDSFEVGQLKTEDKEKIALASPKPIILRPRFLDAQTDDDTLDLMKALRARLRDESFVVGRGANQSVLVFVDDEDFPGGIRPTGRYSLEGNKVTVTLRLRRDGVEIGSPQIITGTKNDVPVLVMRLLESVKNSIRQ